VREAAARRASVLQRVATREVLTHDLRALGVAAGRCLLVNASMSSIGRVAGGAPAVVAALRGVLGSTGTLVVPTGTADNSDTSRAHLDRIKGMTASQVARYRASMPPFDPDTTPSTGAGRIAEEVRTLPGAVRSAHPQTSFAAIGPMASRLMDGHALDCHLGEASPLGRLYEADAWILLLGVGYEACTALHLGEYRYRHDPPRRTYRCVITRDGHAAWWEYMDVDLDDRDLGPLGADLDTTESVHRGRVGAADCRLMPVREAVDFSARWLAEHRLVQKS
jgi:aminoglycoside 3-N-acetyltransferase